MAEIPNCHSVETSGVNPGKDVGSLLKDVYEAHMEALASLQIKIQDLEKKSSKQEQKEAGLVRKVKDLQMKCNKLSSENDSLIKDIHEANTRTCVPCESCQLLRGQLEQQEKFYNMVITRLDEKNDRNECAKLSAENERSGGSTKQDNVEETSLLSRGSKSRLSRNVKRSRASEELAQDQKKPRSESPLKEIVTNRLLPEDETQPPHHHDNSILAVETCDPDRSFSIENTRNGRNIVTSAVEKIQKPNYRPNIVIPETLAFDFGEDENSSDDESLIAAVEEAELSGATEETVIAALNEGSLPSTPERSSYQTKVKPYKSFANKNVANNIDENQNSPTKLNQSQRSIVHHMACNLESVMSEPSSPVFNRSKESARRQDFVSKALISPSLFDEDENDEIPSNSPSVLSSASKKLMFQKQRPIECECSIMHMTSPSALPSRKNQSSIQGNNILYDPVASPVRCADQPSSPSLTRPRSFSTNVKSPRKLIQTKLGNFALRKNSPSKFDLDETWDEGRADSKLEEEQIKLALEISKRQYQINSSAPKECELNLTFTEPQCTSTQKYTLWTENDKNVQFKKPLAHPNSNLERIKSRQAVDVDLTKDMGDDMIVKAAEVSLLHGNFNGTIDPNVHISQYDTPQVVQVETESQLLHLENLHQVDICPAYTIDGNVPVIDLDIEKDCGTQVNMRRSTRNFQKHDDLQERELDANKKPNQIRLKTTSNVDVDKDDDLPSLDNSFDRFPKKQASTEFVYVDVVRKKEERNKLKAFACYECEEYFCNLGLSDEEKQRRLQHCRHKARFQRSNTPEHYWSIRFPDTQEAEEQGILNTTQAKPSKFRRRRGLRPAVPGQQEDD